MRVSHRFTLALSASMRQRALSNLISAGLDQHRHGLDQVARPARAAADLPKELPGLELGVGSFSRPALAGIDGVDLLLRARQAPVPNASPSTPTAATLSTCWTGLTQRQNPESPVGTVRLPARSGSRSTTD